MHQGWDNAQTDLITGVWSYGVVGIRENISFEIFCEGVIQVAKGVIDLNLMQGGMICLEVTVRVAYILANAATRLNPNASRFPFAVLQPV